MNLKHEPIRAPPSVAKCGKHTYLRTAQNMNDCDDVCMGSVPYIANWALRGSFNSLLGESRRSTAAFNLALAREVASAGASSKVIVCFSAAASDRMKFCSIKGEEREESIHPQLLLTVCYALPLATFSTLSKNHSV